MAHTVRTLHDVQSAYTQKHAALCINGELWRDGMTFLNTWFSWVVIEMSESRGLCSATTGNALRMPRSPIPCVSKTIPANRYISGSFPQTDHKHQLYVYSINYFLFFSVQGVPRRLLGRHLALRTTKLLCAATLHSARFRRRHLPIEAAAEGVCPRVLRAAAELHERVVASPANRSPCEQRPV